MSCDDLLAWPQPRPPLLETRDQQALLAQILGRLPGFVPEWRVGDVGGEGDAGFALLAVYARYLDILGDGLNRLPQRSLLAFLDLYGDSLINAQSSRVPLVFSLLPTSPSDVELPARSTVAAKLAPPAPSFLAPADNSVAPVVPLFYTAQTVTLARSQLVAIRSIDPDADCFTDGSAGLIGNAVGMSGLPVAAGFTAFDERTPVGHTMYLGHDKLFALTGTAELVLSIGFAEPARPERLLVLDWEYLSADGWLPLQVIEDTTERLTVEGQITLQKTCGPDAKQDVVSGVTSHWIRATLNGARPFANIVATESIVIEVDAVASWSPGDLLLVDGVLRGIVQSRTGRLVTLLQAAHFDIGEVIDVAAQPSAKVAAAPVTSVQLAATYPFLSGDPVTVDGSAQTTVRRARPGLLEFEAPLGAAEPGARLFLARVSAPLRPQGLDDLGPLPTISQLMARLGISKSGLQVDLAFADTAPLDLGSPFYPLGLQPAPFATVYLASEEAFVLPGAQIELHIELARHVATGGNPLLTWEYFDGLSWQTLGIVQDFLDATAAITLSGIVRFDCPADWAMCEVNGASKHWLRARLDSGDYGQPMQLKVMVDAKNNTVVTSVPATLAPPIISKLRIDYVFFTAFEFPETCLTCNDFVFSNQSDHVRGMRSAFLPFVPIDDRARALHIGYSDKLPTGLLSTYVAVEDGSGEPVTTSPFLWEYRNADGWTKLSVLDGTNGFTTSGMLQWVGPADAIATPGFGGLLFRLRARLRLGESVVPTRFTALWPNAVWGVQGETVQQLALGDSDGQPGQSFPFRPDKVPVLPGETIEVREWAGRGDDWQSAVAGVDVADLRFEREALTGIATAVWVRWQSRSTLYGAGADERAYVLERSGGLLEFGNDRHGRIPPAGARIVASFATGGDIIGNVPAFSITELRTGIAYLQGVTNPIAASGGAATETLPAIERRGPQQFRNRDRSVSFEDYEWLAREASPDVARVRCLPVTGPDGRPQRGHVSLLIAPQSSDAQPAPSVELARRVREFLAAHCPATVARRIGIASPRYVPVSVHATIVPAVASTAATVSQNVHDACERFLHPLSGGVDGNGWQFGEPVYMSQIAALLEATAGVDHCAEIRLLVGDALRGDRVAVGADAIVASGSHEVSLVLAVPASQAFAGVG